MKVRRSAAVVAGSCFAVALAAAPAAAQSMMFGQNGFTVSDPLLTIGESIGDYVPVGVLDGLGAYELDENTVRVLANHELLHFRGNEYQVNDGNGGTFGMTGARISYFDIDKGSRQIVDAGPAYHTIYDGNGDVASDTSFLGEPGGAFSGFSRFCSSGLFEAGEFDGRGLATRVYLTGEEDGGAFNNVGGAEWALDPATGSIWQLPALGRGAWENVTVVDTGDADTVGIILADDSSPFNFDNDPENEAAPLYLYIGTKDSAGDFAARNGLRGGKLYVWVADNGELTPTNFNGQGASISGTWVEIDNAPTGPASLDGSTGFDLLGYPTQGTLWNRAEAVGAFGFSRPEDVATNPADGTEIVLASTGVDTFENGVDTFGTIYLVKTDFSDLSATMRILYDGDADKKRRLRSPDNLDWADDGFIYVQEDKAEDDTLDGEPLFGPGAANRAEAGIVRLNPNANRGAVVRIAQIDRSVVLDGSIVNPADAVDMDAGTAGEWESSGIIDVSALFGEKPGTLFLFDVQAHGIVDQEEVNAMSRINDGDLVEGGQLLFLEKNDD